MTTRLLRTLGTPTDQKIFTWSAWVKRTRLGSDMALFNSNNAGSTNVTMRFDSDDTLHFFYISSSSYAYRIQTTAKFRDVSAWYHLVFIQDTTQSTAGDRLQIYVNGERQTSLQNVLSPSLNATTNMNSAVAHYIGDNGGSNPFDGLMSHVHFVDGTAYPASTFGSTDATTGEWRIITVPSVTYGNNGFFILKNSNSLTDESPNSNNWAVDTGTLSSTQDNPSNNFATLNRISFKEPNMSTSNGGNVISTGNTTNWINAVCATLVATGGKFYWEAKWTDGDSYSILGFLEAKEIHRCAASTSGGGSDIYFHANAIQTDNGGGSPQRYRLVNTDDTISVTAPPGCIFSFALDTENRKCWLGVNGVFYNSGDPAAGTNPTWDTTDIPADGEFVPYAQGYKISGATQFQFNFGNGLFGSSTIASAGNNASNLGSFEYDVPSGFTALCTKGLNL